MVPTITLADFGEGASAGWAIAAFNHYVLKEPRGMKLPELAHLLPDEQLVLKEWRAFVHNAVAAMACVLDEEDAAELNELRDSDWEERVQLLYKFQSYLGGPVVPLGPRVLFGLGTTVQSGGPAQHPRAPPVLRPDRARLLLLGDSTLWGVSSNVSKQGQKAEARDVIGYLKTHFPNLRGEGLWGAGIYAINTYLRSYLEDFDPEKAFSEELVYTGTRTSTGNEFWERPSKWAEWVADHVPEPYEKLRGQGYSASLHVDLTGVSKPYQKVIETRRELGPADGPDSSMSEAEGPRGLRRPMDPSKDAVFVFWGVNEVIEYDSHGHRGVYQSFRARLTIALNFQIKSGTTLGRPTLRRSFCAKLIADRQERTDFTMLRARECNQPLR